MNEPLRPGSDAQKLHLSDKDWDHYVQRVQRTPPTDAEQRADARYRKIAQCVLRVHHGEGPVYVIHCRDIGGGGMGFLHTEPLPADADCTVVLETNRGEGQIINGRVRWSRDIGGGLHAVGVVFDRALDLTQFVDVSDSATGEAYAA